MNIRVNLPKNHTSKYKYTDLLFGGTSIYVIDLAFRDDLFILYNPCNKYESLMFN